jgi:uncharacterized damage-inducible protein DinB
MLNQEDVRLLFEYDRWANWRVLGAAAKLSAEEFTRELGGSYRSVRDTLVHIVAGEVGWLRYWNLPEVSAGMLHEFWKRLNAEFDPEQFPTLREVKAKWEMVEKEQREFVEGVTEESLGKTYPIGKVQICLAQLLQHLANHSTYHRGQVAMMMRQLGREAVETDFCEFLMGREE